MSKDLVTQKTGALSAFEGWKDDEHLEQDEFLIPFLRIAQKMSPQVDSENAAYVEGLSQGDFFNTATGSKFGPVLKVQVLGYFRNFIMWEKEEGKTIGEFRGAIDKEQFEAVEKTTNLERHRGDMVHKGGADNGKDIHYTDTRNFICVLPDFPEEGLLILPLSSTGIKAAKNWNSKNSIRQAPRPATIWELETKTFTKDDNSWKQISRIDAVAWTTKEQAEIALKFKDFANNIKKDSEALNKSYESTETVVEETEF